MWSELRRVLREPPVARPPGPARWDLWLAIALLPAFVAEALLRDGIAGRPLHVAFGLGILGAVWQRRASPLGATAVGFGVATASTLVLRAFGLEGETLHANICVLLLPYSLLRWGSGREVALGLAVLASAYASAALRGEMRGLGDVIGAAVVMLFPGALGASVRFRAESHAQELAQMKLRERADLARDLHDTVAHHVAAIAIQAQAGRLVLATRPEATGSALEAIESEAARTLAELRSMVGALRDDRDASLAPQPVLADLVRLARRVREVGRDLAVEVEIDEGLDGLRPALQTALYRIAQESITNARRHARGASRVRVRVTTKQEAVRMTVEDDGAASSRRGSGFGLVGMSERAALLGGRLEAGPQDGGSWRVEVALPFERGPR